MSAHDDEASLPCPTCGYDLCGHSGDPRRCPECGRVSALAEMRRPPVPRYRRRLVIGLAITAVACAAIQAAMILPYRHPSGIQVSLGIRLQILGWATLGPSLVLMDDPLGELDSLLPSMAALAAVVTPLIWPRRLVPVILAHLGVAFWFVTGCGVAALMMD